MASASEAWDALPADEARSVWDETERNFWANQQRLNDAAAREADKAYHQAVTEVKVEMSRLNSRRGFLTESQARLTEELAKVEEELARVVTAFDEKANHMNKIEEDHRDNQQARLENQQKVRRTMRQFFKEKRGEDASTEENLEDYDDGFAPPSAWASQISASQSKVNGTTITPVRIAPRERDAVTPEEDTAMSDVEMPNGDYERSDDVMADVVDAEGNIIGPVERIEPWNQWVEAIQDLEVRRPVKIRKGRRFNETHLATIYERTEAKGVKWLSCMIQATGQIQTKRCQSCEKNQGAFDDCIIVGGDLFQKCGNCEWNRQGCHGASGDYIDMPTARRRQRRRDTRDTQESPTEREADVVEIELTPEAELTPEPEEGFEEEIKSSDRRYQETRQQETRQQEAREQESRQQETRPQETRRQTPPATLLHPLPLALPPQAPPPSSLPSRPPQAPPQASPPGSLPSRPPQAPPSGSLPSRPAQSTQPVQPAQADRAQPSTEVDTPMKDVPAINNSSVPREPEQMPTPQEYRITPGFTPANAAQRSRPPSADRPTPTSLHIEPSPQPTESFPAEELEEICRDMLALRDNGTVYTYPECVEGVPLEKIDENHPYWELNWPNVRTLIEPQLAKWREKHQAAIEAGPKTEKGGSSKYQIGRQVNRGVKILEFLEEGDISPYQLLSKKYISSGKGGICSYDTLFRLSETMSELAKFKLDIKPVEWMRQRLYELIQVEGSSFNLPRTIHDFYHDPKLTSLRFKHGFKNIGRPSGMKSVRNSLGSPNSTPKPIKKRKSMHSLNSTPRETPFVENSPLATQVTLPPPPERTSAPKRAKLSPPLLPGAAVPGSIRDGYRDEFHFNEHSDTESWSGATVGKNDFQLRLVKTRRYTSTANVTQYWTWQEDHHVFEHQVLKALNPVEWGIHRQPYNFHLKLDDITKLVWNIQALRIHVVLRKETDDQGRIDIMAEFKRENTMRRFLNFCREQNISLAKESEESVNRRWESMYSEVLPGKDGKPSHEFLKA